VYVLAGVFDAGGGVPGRPVREGFFRSGDRWVVAVAQPDSIDGVYLPVGWQPTA
jgi:hypothetical protein